MTPRYPQHDLALAIEQVLKVNILAEPRAPCTTVLLDIMAQNAAGNPRWHSIGEFREALGAARQLGVALKIDEKSRSTATGQGASTAAAIGAGETDDGC